MNLFQKLNFSSKAKNGDLVSILKGYYDTEDDGKEFIHDLIDRYGLTAKLLVYLQDPDPPQRIFNESQLPMLAVAGNAETLPYLVREHFSFGNLPGYKDTLLTVYQKYESPELRVHLIFLIKEELRRLNPRWGGDNWQKVFIQVGDMLQGWEFTDCDILIPLLASHTAEVSAILSRFNPQVVEKLIPWLKYKGDKTDAQTLTMEPEFDPLNDTWSPSRKAYMAADYPTARCVEALLFQLTGKHYNHTK